MAMMAKMRSLAPIFILTVGGLFVLFMVVSDSNVLEALGGRSNYVGVVNGDEITYQEFNNALEQQRAMMQQQSGRDIEEEEMDQFREQVWDAIVTQKLLAQQMEEFGITVSDKEIEEIILSDNPPEFLKQNFIDSTGRFNSQLYRQALLDPRNTEAILEAEDYVRQNRLNEKLQSLLLASINVSEAEVQRKFAEQNIKMNAQFALIDLNLFPDSIINVTDAELKDYYNKNLDRYKVLPQRKLKYVMFSTSPSSADSASKRAILEKVADNYKNDTMSFKQVTEIYSETPYSIDTVSISQLDPSAADALSKAQPNTLVGPIATQEGFVLYNFLNSISSNETMVKASHILVNQFGSDEQNLEEANKIYQQIQNGADFEELAREKSADPGSGQRGGDLGWFGRGAMVPEFDKAAFSGEVGVVQKPVKSNFGYHIIKVTGKSDKNYIVEKIVNPITPSATTVDEIYNSAVDFAYLADKNDFEKEAEILKYEINETPAFLAEAVSVPGLGANKRIVQFAFDNDLNSISDPFKVPGGYVVVKVSEVTKEAVRPLEEVKDMIRPLVLREKKFERAKELASKVKAQINGDLNKAASVDSRIVVNQTGEFSAGGTVPTVGRDFAFIQHAMDAETNKISEPVKGQRGYYLIKVTERSTLDTAAYETQRENILNNILQEKKAVFFNQWLAKVKKDAKIVDNRHLIYGQ
jgi:peptidyl-prolyl cis-trans isomerase D